MSQQHGVSSGFQVLLLTCPLDLRLHVRMLSLPTHHICSMHNGSTNAERSCGLYCLYDLHPAIFRMLNQSPPLQQSFWQPSAPVLAREDVN